MLQNEMVKSKKKAHEVFNLQSSSQAKLISDFQKKKFRYLLCFPLQIHEGCSKKDWG